MTEECQNMIIHDLETIFDQMNTLTNI